MKTILPLIIAIIVVFIIATSGSIFCQDQEVRYENGRLSMRVNDIKFVELMKKVSEETKIPILVESGIVNNVTGEYRGLPIITSIQKMIDGGKMNNVVIECQARIKENDSGVDVEKIFVVQKDGDLQNKVLQDIQDDSLLVDSYFAIAAGKINDGRGDIEAVARIISLSEKAIPRLKQLTKHKDSEIRMTAFGLLFRMDGSFDNDAKEHALSDIDPLVQIIPAVVIQSKKRNDKDDELLSACKNIIKTSYNKSKYHKAIEWYRMKRYLTNESFNAFKERRIQNIRMLIEYYFNVVGKEALKDLEQELNNGGSDVLEIYAGISSKYPENNYGINILVEQLNNENEKWSYRSRIVSMLIIMAQNHPDYFNSDIRSKLEIYLNEKGKQKQESTAEKTSEYLNVHLGLEKVLKKVDTYRVINGDRNEP